MTYKQNLQAILDSHLTEIKDEIKDSIIDNILRLSKEDKTGKWECVVYDANINIMNWHCSECRNIVIFTAKSHIKPYYKYCPWCGIKMEVKE